MKQSERTFRTREKIMTAAMHEFGTKGYSSASMNNICDTGISKGLLYHNYANKNDLYLTCVKKSFADLTERLKSSDIGNDMEKYMSVRVLFFNENKDEAAVFFEALIQPPAVLAPRIAEIRKDFDDFNREIYLSVISGINLRPGVTRDNALEYFALMQDLLNGYYGIRGSSAQQLSEHEKSLSKLLEFMLYGIAEGGGQ